ncbi:MAG: hypothetical protein ACR2Q3_01460 [Woeseiaceae bacterium]
MKSGFTGHEQSLVCARRSNRAIDRPPRDDVASFVPNDYKVTVN